jgi:hypothetical protein
MGFFKRRSRRPAGLLDTEALAIEATSAASNSGISGNGAEGQCGPSSSKASNRGPKLSVNVSLSAWLRLVRLQSASRTKPSTQTPKLTTINSQQAPASISGKTEILNPYSIQSATQNSHSDTTVPLQPSGPASQTTPPKPPPPTTLTTTQSASTMAERTLQQVITQLRGNPSYEQASSLLSKAKLSLLQLKALTPTPSTPSNLLAVAREVYELGAITSIRARNPDAFKRYVQQLQPFYELPSSQLKPNPEARNKVTGLYLLLLLTEGRYDIFHSELESLSMHVGNGGFEAIEADRYLGYPIKLERWLMEGSYDRVWKAMKKGEVPSEEFGIFSQVRSTEAIGYCRGQQLLPIQGFQEHTVNAD